MQTSEGNQWNKIEAAVVNKCLLSKSNNLLHSVRAQRILSNRLMWGPCYDIETLVLVKGNRSMSHYFNEKVKPQGPWQGIICAFISHWFIRIYLSICRFWTFNVRLWIKEAVSQNIVFASFNRIIVINVLLTLPGMGDFTNPTPQPTLKVVSNYLYINIYYTIPYCIIIYN